MSTTPISSNLPKVPLILVVDDSHDDLLLVQMAFRKLSTPVSLKCILGGEEALAYLLGQGAYADRSEHPLPRLVLLDLKMPVVSGFDVLAELKRSDMKKPPFVCVFSSSELESDVKRAFALGADIFHTKPVDYQEFNSLMERLALYYCLQNNLPER